MLNIQGSSVLKYEFATTMYVNGVVNRERKFNSIHYPVAWHFRVCCVCNRPFTSCSFTIYPNGVMAHPSCAPDPSVCPLTGTVFQAAHVSPTSTPSHQYRLWCAVLSEFRIVEYSSKWFCSKFSYSIHITLALKLCPYINLASTDLFYCFPASTNHV